MNTDQRPIRASPFSDTRPHPTIPRSLMNMRRQHNPARSPNQGRSSTSSGTDTGRLTGSGTQPGDSHGNPWLPSTQEEAGNPRYDSTDRPPTGSRGSEHRAPSNFLDRPVDRCVRVGTALGHQRLDRTCGSPTHARCRNACGAKDHSWTPTGLGFPYPSDQCGGPGEQSA